MEFPKTQQQNIFDTPLTVTQFIETVNQRLKTLPAKIIGEIGRVDEKNGHRYFSLKDEKNGSTLACIIWRSRYEMFGIPLKEGMKIIASGSSQVYAASGKFSFVCDTIELVGEGALKKAYDALLKKLAAEGLLDIERKRKLPAFPRTIGIITSRQGAVINDFLTNIGKFGFILEMIDSRVEGQLAVDDILKSIHTFKKRKIDILVIMRGGGSPEALQAFNNETIVREIAAFPIPVIAAIGHDKDVPLVAMVADIAVSTPTQAAHKVCESWQKVVQLVAQYEISIIGGYKTQLAATRSKINQHIAILSNFQYILQNISQTMDLSMAKILNLARSRLANINAQLHSRISILTNFKYIVKNITKSLETSKATLVLKIETGLLDAKKQLKYSEQIIQSHNPERQLKLGYSIAKINGKILKSIAGLKNGNALDIALSDGIINSQIVSTNSKIYEREKEN